MIKCVYFIDRIPFWKPFCYSYLMVLFCTIAHLCPVWILHCGFWFILIFMILLFSLMYWYSHTYHCMDSNTVCQGLLWWYYMISIFSWWWFLYFPGDWYWGERGTSMMQINICLYVWESMLLQPLWEKYS